MKLSRIQFWFSIMKVCTIVLLTGWFKTQLIAGEPFNSPALHNSSSNRTWVTARFIKSWEVKDKDVKLLNPSLLKLDRIGNVYVVDPGIPGVIKLSAQGQFITLYGGTRGKGPGEIIKPHDVAISDNGNVYISDPGAGRIVVFSSDGRFQTEISVMGGINLAVVDDSLVVVTGGQNMVFTLYNYEGDLVRRFGDVDIQNPMVPMMLQFWVFAQDKNVYAVGLNSNEILAYSIFGKEIYKTTLRDKVDNPLARISKWNTKQNSEMVKGKIFTQSYVNAMNASIDENYLSVLSYPLSKELNAVVLDRYQLANGKYKDSFRFDKPVDTDYVLSVALRHNVLISLEILKKKALVVRKYRIEKIATN